MTNTKMKKKIFNNISNHLLLIILSLIILMPILIGISVSFQEKHQIFSYPPSFIPKNINFNNYFKAWKGVNLGRLLWNSFFASIIVTLAKLFCGITSGFAFSHFEFKGKTFLFFFIFITLMLPLQVMVVPLFQFVSKLGWANTYQGLVLPFFASATTTFLILQHFSTIPKELMEAAEIDGCGPIGFLTKILIPISGSTIAGLATINFLVMWNTYLWPLIIINSNDMKVAQQGIKMCYAGMAERDWGLIMACTIMVIIPSLIIFMFSQKFFVKGIANQGLKD